MSVQIYFGVISSTLLCFSSQRFRRVFQKHIHVPSLFLPLHPPIFSFSVSFYPSFFFDLLGFSMDFSLSWQRKGPCGQGRLDLLCCHTYSGLLQHPLRLQTRAAATDVETPVNQVSVRDLCSMHSSRLLLLYYM